LSATGTELAGWPRKKRLAGTSRMQPDRFAFLAYDQPRAIFAADSDAQQALSAARAASNVAHIEFLRQERQDVSKRKSGDHAILLQDQTHLGGRRIPPAPALLAANKSDPSPQIHLVHRADALLP
jgi:hypothetical protein